MADKITKAQIVAQLQESGAFPTKKAAEEAVASVLGAISQSTATGAEVDIAGFGKFYTRESAARDGRNPKTGEVIKIQASKSPAFRPAAAFKALFAAK